MDNHIIYDNLKQKISIVQPVSIPHVYKTSNLFKRPYLLHNEPLNHHCFMKQRC